MHREVRAIMTAALSWLTQSQNLWIIKQGMEQGTFILGSGESANPSSLLSHPKLN